MHLEQLGFTCFTTLAKDRLADHALFLTQTLTPFTPLLSGAPLLTSIMNAPFCHSLLVTHLVHS